MTWFWGSNINVTRSISAFKDCYTYVNANLTDNSEKRLGFKLHDCCLVVICDERLSVFNY